MKALRMLIVLCIMGLVCMSQNTNAQNNQPNPIDKNPNELIKTAKSGRKFVENKGQWDANVLGMTQSDGMDIWVTKEGLVYDVFKYTKQDNSKSVKNPNISQDLKSSNPMENMKREGHVFKMEFLNNKTIKAHCVGKQKSYYNYFVGDKSKWASQVGHYDEMLMDESFDGIDTRLHFDNGNFRYDFIVKENADPKKIAFRINGAEDSKINANGEIDINTSLGKITQNKLFAYQEFGTNKKQIKCSFVKGEDGNYHFEVGKYDKSKKLIIDPTVVFSTYLGGLLNDYGVDISADQNGNIYVIGNSDNETNFPVTIGAYRTTCNTDSFVSKFDQTGQYLIYSTFIGGNEDKAIGTSIDLYRDLNKSRDLIYITGYYEIIKSTDPMHNYDLMSITNKMQTIVDISNSTVENYAFLIVLDAKGSQNNDLIYSTFWGVSGIPTPIYPNPSSRAFATPKAISVNQIDGKAYIVGRFEGSNYPFKNAFYTSEKGDFLTVINPENRGINDIFFSSYLKGAEIMDVKGKNSIAYLVGYSYPEPYNGGLRSSIPCVLNACNGVTPYQVTVHQNSTEGFLMGIAINSTPYIKYATLFGGEGDDVITSIDVISNNRVAITGFGSDPDINNSSRTFPLNTSGAYNDGITNRNPKFAFYSIFDISLSANSGLIYNTVFGSSLYPVDIKIDRCYQTNSSNDFRVHIFGELENSPNLITLNPVENTPHKLFISSFESNNLIFSTYLKGDNASLDYNISDAYKRGGGICASNQNVTITYNEVQNQIIYPGQIYPPFDGIINNGSIGNFDACITSINIPCTNQAQTECCNSITLTTTPNFDNNTGQCCITFSLSKDANVNCGLNIEVQKYENFQYSTISSNGHFVNNAWSSTYCSNTGEFKGRIKISNSDGSLLCYKDIPLITCYQTRCCKRVKNLSIIKVSNPNAGNEKCCIRIKGLIDTKDYEGDLNCINNIQIMSINPPDYINSNFTYTTGKNQIEFQSDIVCLPNNSDGQFIVIFKNNSTVLCQRQLTYHCTADCCELIKKNAVVTFKELNGVPNCYDVMIDIPENNCGIVKIETYKNGGFVINQIAQSGFISLPYTVGLAFCCNPYELLVANNFSFKIYLEDGTICDIAATKVCGVTGKQGTIDQEKDDANNNHSQILDYNIQPNPTNDKTTINFTLTEKANVKLELFNSLGNSVSVIKEQMFNLGANVVEFDASQLSQGVYFVKVSIDGTNSITIPLSVVK